MAEFDKAIVLIHMYAGPYIFTRDLPAAKKMTIMGNQHTVNTPITIASVKAKGLSDLLLTETNVFPFLDDCFFLFLNKNIEIVIDTYHPMTRP